MALSNQLLSELGAKYGTPLYVYDGDLVSQRYEEICEYIPYSQLKVFYAMKANFNPAILKLLCSLGSSIDAVSPGDVELALKCGFPKERILFTANNITDQEMHAVFEQGVLLNLGSLSRLKKYAEAFPGTEMCLRFNPDVVAGGHENIRTGGGLTKFGILVEDIEEVKHIVQGANLKVVGIHKHTGSGVRFEEKDKFLQAMRNLCALASRGNFPELEFVDFGGGFNVPYAPTDEQVDYPAFGKKVMDIIESVNETYGSKLDVYCEPGKFLVAEAGHLLVEVNTLKNNKGRLIAGTNSGFSQLIRPMFYQAYHQIDNLSNPDGSDRLYDICGNICETGDLFASDRPVAEIHEGDTLAIRNAGAYCYAMGSVYNLRSMPAEVMVLEGEDKLVRRRLSDSEVVDMVVKESDCA